MGSRRLIILVAAIVIAVVAGVATVRYLQTVQDRANKGAIDRPIKPDIPQPNSTIVASSVRIEFCQRKLSLLTSQAATSGVTFHNTAPVVPPSTLVRSSPGD